MGDQSPVVIVTDRLVLRMPRPREADRVVTYFEDNEDHLAPWDPPRPPGFFTQEFWERQLARNLEERATDRSLRLFLFERGAANDTPAIGMCNLTNFVRGALQACHLGYNLDRRLQGQGIMTEGLRAALEYAFDELRLHRVMANHMPSNERSARVLEQLGFVREGYAKDYLYIAGAWEDHVLTALVNPTPRAPM